MQVRLITAQSQIIWVAKDIASVLDSRIITGELNLAGKLKIHHLTTLPNQKGVGRNRRFRLSFSDNSAVFDSPQASLTLPTTKVFAVKQCLKLLRGSIWYTNCGN